MIVIHFDYTWKSLDGTILYGQTWQPEEKPLAIVCLVHGIGEHSSRYTEWASLLVEVGYAVIAIDYRGHGKSEGKQGFVNSYDDLMNDIDVLLNQADNIYPQIAKILYGHSLGGNLVINYVLKRKPKIKALIATSPWLKLGIDISKTKFFFGLITKFIYPNLTMNSNLQTEYLTHNQKQINIYLKDKLVHNKVSANLFFGAYDAAQWAIENADNIYLPTLIMHGSSDKITSPTGSIQFAEKANNKVALKIWENAYHELHNELNSIEIFKYFWNWLKNN